MTFSIVFPGQGSQSPGMQAALAEAFPEVATTYREASEVLGFDLWRRVQDGAPEALARTTLTQPAMLTAGVAAWRCWQTAGGASPAVVAGHSLGEYTALVCAGSLAFSAALTLVQRRAKLMQDAVPEGVGAMAAVLGLADDAVREVCVKAAGTQVVSAVNFNSPGQVVIAGEREAVERAIEQAKAAGAKRAMLLNVSVPSHCALMQPAAEALAADLQQTKFSAPRFPVINNADVQEYRDAAHMRDGLQRQLYSPVRWVETVQRIVTLGAGTLIECGPGKVLTGLMKRIDRSIDSALIDDPESLQSALEQSRA